MDGTMVTPGRLAAVAACLLLSAGAAGAEIPESQRSRAAVERVETDLKAEVARAGLAWGAAVFIRIFKQESELEIWLRGGESFRLFRTFPICAFSGGLGPKLRQGDGQSPEGFYFVTPERMNPHSSYHLSFNLGYPNAYDRAHGRTVSYLMVHGDCVSIGCYAMARHRLPIGAGRNRPIEEIWTLMRAAFLAGQPFIRVHAFPFRMTEANLRRHAGSRWRDFWANLKQGHDLFERDRRPPDTTVRGARYVFAPN